MEVQEAEEYIAMAKDFHKDHGCIGAESFETCTAVVCITANKLQRRLTKRAADGLWTCRNCGRKNIDGFKFCSRCNTARR